MYCALAGAIRPLLMYSEFQKIISDRVEVSTALNSWKRGETYKTALSMKIVFFNQKMKLIKI